MLVRVVAPHFVAGMLVERGDDGVERITHAAPILRWAVGKSRQSMQVYFALRGWRASVVSAS